MSRVLLTVLLAAAPIGGNAAQERTHCGFRVKAAVLDLVDDRGATSATAYRVRIVPSAEKFQKRDEAKAFATTIVKDGAWAGDVLFPPHRVLRIQVVPAECGTT